MSTSAVTASVVTFSISALLWLVTVATWVFSKARSPRAVALILSLGRHCAIGHALHWIKSKNPAAPAMKREGEEDLLCSDAVVGRIFKANAAPVGSPWMWTLAFGHHEDRTATHGYAATREAAMAAFAKSWRRY